MGTSGPRFLTPGEVMEVSAMWREGENVDSVCRAIGITRDTLNQRRKDQLRHLPKRAVGSGRKGRRPDPSPAEITERAAEIRQAWTEDERLERLCGVPELQVWRWPE